MLKPWQSHACEKFRDAYDLVLRSRSGRSSDYKIVLPSFFEFGNGYMLILTEPWNVYNGFFTCVTI